MSSLTPPTGIIGKFMGKTAFQDFIIDNVSLGVVAGKYLSASHPASYALKASLIEDTPSIDINNNDRNY